eukprot:scaffold84344_cov17-Tisochrysis_lutea.AAC.1
MEAALVLSEVLILPLCLLPTACLNPGTDKHWYELGAIKAGHQGSKWPRYSNKFYLPLICFLLNQGMAGMLETYHLLYAFFLLAVGISFWPLYLSLLQCFHFYELEGVDLALSCVGWGHPSFCRHLEKTCTPEVEASPQWTRIPHGGEQQLQAHVKKQNIGSQMNFSIPGEDEHQLRARVNK